MKLARRPQRRASTDRPRRTTDAADRQQAPITLEERAPIRAATGRAGSRPLRHHRVVMTAFHLLDHEDHGATPISTRRTAIARADHRADGGKPIIGLTSSSATTNAKSDGVLTEGRRRTGRSSDEMPARHGDHDAPETVAADAADDPSQPRFETAGPVARLEPTGRSAIVVVSREERKYSVSTMMMKPLNRAPSTASPMPTAPPKIAPTNFPSVT